MYNLEKHSMKIYFVRKTFKSKELKIHNIIMYLLEYIAHTVFAINRRMKTTILSAIQYINNFTNHF